MVRMWKVVPNLAVLRQEGPQVVAGASQASLWYKSVNTTCMPAPNGEDAVGGPGGPGGPGEEALATYLGNQSRPKQVARPRG